MAKPDAPECLDETKAFFVSSASGDDPTGDGTKAKPFKTLATVLGKVTEQKKRIYICEGTYAEDVVLEAKHAGVSLFGGFACDWTKSPSANKPKFGYGTTALKIAGATGIAIADLAFEAKDATTPGGSSIAAFVANSEVSFKGVSLSAGKGSRGADGVLTAFQFPAAAELNGKNGDPPGNGGETAIRCPADPPGTISTKGGKGGESGVPGDPGTPGAANGGTVGVCAGPGTGGDGATGTSPNNALGATVLGDLDGTGWHPASGESGPPGGPGQGGGGGYGSGGGSARGGGGAAGGCGGAGGGGGKGGGASIALAALASTVRTEACVLTSNVAGDGGNGADGQPGQSPGGFGGNPTNATPSCKGGNGGPGGQGAAGGGGAGGISVGVLYKGTEPTLDPATAANISLGKEGARGTGPGTPGIDGLSAPKLGVK